MGRNWPEGALIINPFDEYAIEEALRIRSAPAGQPVTLSFGKSSAESVARYVGPGEWMRHPS